MEEIPLKRKRGRPPKKNQHLKKEEKNKYAILPHYVGNPEYTPTEKKRKIEQHTPILLSGFMKKSISQLKAIQRQYLFFKAIEITPYIQMLELFE